MAKSYRAQASTIRARDRQARTSPTSPRWATPTGATGTPKPAVATSGSFNGGDAGVGGHPVAGYSSQELMTMANSHPSVPDFPTKYRERGRSRCRSLRRCQQRPSGQLFPPERARGDGQHLRSGSGRELGDVRPASPARRVRLGDAGIGATSGFAFAPILAGTLLILLRQKSRGQGAGTAETA